MRTLPIITTLTITGLIVGGLYACGATPDHNAGNGEQMSPQDTTHHWNRQQLQILRDLHIESLPENPSPTNRVADDSGAAIFGKTLFFDRRFSANGQIACADCHKPQHYFSDGLRVATGLAKGNRNTPTIVGSGYGAWFFRDGRSDSLWSQALGPMENALEQGGNRIQFAHLVYRDPELRRRYEALFGPLPDLSDTTRFPLLTGPFTNPGLQTAWRNMRQPDRASVTQVFVNRGKSLAAYERRLKPTAARFDRYVSAALAGDSDTMRRIYSNGEVNGLRLFITKAMCHICHNGPLFSDFEFHNINTQKRRGKPYDWGRYYGVQQLLKSEFNCRSEYSDASEKSCKELRFIVKDKQHTVAAFKTPSLRNISKTAPYMHAGQFATLAEVIRHYNDPPAKIIGSSNLLKIELNSTEQQHLEAFLRTLDSAVQDISNIAP